MKAEVWMGRTQQSDGPDVVTVTIALRYPEPG